MNPSRSGLWPGQRGKCGGKIAKGRLRQMYPGMVEHFGDQEHTGELLKNVKIIMEIQLTLRESASAGSDILTEGEAGVAPGKVTCPVCHGQYQGARGLGVHQRRAHPEVFHAEHQVKTRLNSRWLPEERDRIATAEADLTVSGLKPVLMNSRLLRIFKELPRERLKGLRKRQDYKDKVEELVASARALKCLSESEDELPGADTGSHSGEDWRKGALEACIEGLDNLRVVRPELNGEPLVMDLYEVVHESTTRTTEGDITSKRLMDRYAVRLTTYLQSHSAGTKSRMPRKGPKRPSGLYHRRPKGGRTKRKVNPARVKRMAAYKRVQEAFRRNRKRCADMVLDGTWEQEESSLPLEAQEEFWRPIFSEPSAADDRPVPKAREDWSIVDPVTAEEVAKAIHDSEDSAPGRDGVALGAMKMVDPQALATYYTLWLLQGYIPECFMEGETILIPKSGDLLKPGNYRPITTASRVTRIFHKILAFRLTMKIPLDPRQKAFIPLDGCADNIFLLDSIIKGAQRQRKPVCLAFLDVAKAFDCVSHETLARSLRRLGVPAPLVDYVRTMYANTITTLKVGGKRSAPIKCGRGVRQGDPLSAILFNCVMDEVLAALNPAIGFFINKDQIVRCMAFADDLVLIASSAEGLREQVQRVDDALHLGGLSLNPTKCASLRIDIDGKAKRWVVNPSSFLTIGDDSVEALSVVQTYKYLGLQVGPLGVRRSHADLLRVGLERLTRAPLKPQQRMFLLRCHLLPKLYHGLVLGEITAGSLEQLDRSVRAAVRKFLCLPHDTPTAFFHASAKDGGLEVPRLRYTIPPMKAKRMAKLESTLDPVMQAVVTGPVFLGARKRCLQAARAAGTELRCSADVRELLSTQLHASVDGRGLKQQGQTPHVNRWVTDGSALLSGGDYIQAVKVRGNLMPSGERSSRGRREGPMMCDAGCNAQSTLAHTSQSCVRTHRLRCGRHDSVLDLIVKRIEAQGHTVLREPNIPTGVGWRKPDLVAQVDGVAHIVDVTITADCNDMSGPYAEKVRYYNRTDIIEWVKNIFPGSPCELGAVVLNWRGSLHRASSALLRRLGVGAADETLLSVRVLTFTANMFKHYTRSAVGKASERTAVSLLPGARL